MESEMKHFTQEHLNEIYEQTSNGPVKSGYKFERIPTGDTLSMLKITDINDDMAFDVFEKPEGKNWRKVE